LKINKNKNEKFKKIDYYEKSVIGSLVSKLLLFIDRL